MDPAAKFTFFKLDLGDKGEEEPKVDEKGDPVRKRQQHRKSRNGCATCKRRKVKCDETQPSCLNCTKRGLECNIIRSTKLLPRRPKIEERDVRTKDAGQQCDLDLEVPPAPFDPALFMSALDVFPNQQTYTSTSSSRQSTLPPDFSSSSSSTQYFVSSDSPSSILSPGTLSQLCQQYHPDWSDNTTELLDESPLSTISGSIDLILRRSYAERELIQHFEMFTSKTLPFAPMIWETEVLVTALQYDYVMSAIMLVAASHINHYLPKNDISRRPILVHFGNAVSGLRLALNEQLSTENFNAVISCSFLLMVYTWTYIDTTPGTQVNIVDTFTAPVELFHCLKDIIVSSKYLIFQTSWNKYFAYRPTETLEEYNRIHRVRLGDFAERATHTILCGLGSLAPDCSSADNINAISRLTIVLSAVKLAQPDVQGSGIADDVYRYILTWPAFCTKGFLQQVKDDNPATLTILLLYYAAVLGVLTEKVWWMKDRANFMYAMLLKKLEGRCGFCTGPAIELAEGGQLIVTGTGSVEGRCRYE